MSPKSHCLSVTRHPYLQRQSKDLDFNLFDHYSGMVSVWHAQCLLRQEIKHLNLNVYEGKCLRDYESHPLYQESGHFQLVQEKNIDRNQHPDGTDIGVI